MSGNTEYCNGYSEFILHNAVDKNFNRLLAPLHFIQLFFFTPKYRIRDGFITPISNLLKIMCFCANLWFVIACLFNMIVNYFLIEFDVFVRITAASEFLIKFVGFTTNFIVSVSQSDNYVKLYLKLQSICKCLKKKDLPFFNIFTWACFIGYVCHFSLIYYHGHTSNILGLILYYDCICAFPAISFKINIIYAAQVMKIIRKALYSWLRVNKRVFLKNNTDPNDCKFELYWNILEARDMWQECFQLLVSTYSWW